MKMPEHKHFTEEKKDLKALLVTVSTTRTGEDDSTGKLASELAGRIGLKWERKVVKDDEREILLALLENLEEFDAFVYMGGTGLTRYDLTVQALRKIADKEVSGFGELFRSRSDTVFASLSNATMFTYGDRLVFCLPGAPNAQETGFSIIGEIIFHSFHEVSRK